MKDKFKKLMASMSEKKKLANPGIDEGFMTKREIDMIDEKIAKLEASEDPNALESINFWKQRRAKIAGN